MTSWIDLVDGDTAIRTIFGEQLPSLRGISVHALAFQRDGPSLIMEFDLATYPLRPPRKWSAQNFNTVRVQLRLGPLLAVTMSGWTSTTPIADMSLDSNGDSLAVSIRGGELSLDAVARSAFLAKISAYIDGDKLGPHPGSA
jgi:hypothetical protein